MKETPEDVEDVIVEADGEWHTSDNAYASAVWKAAHPPKALSPTKVEDAPLAQPNGSANGKNQGFEPEIFILDSDDDDDEGQIQRELSAYASSSRTSYDAMPRTQSQTSATVIDLTLDDDDEDDDSDDGSPSAPTNNFGKRKASEANIDSVQGTEPQWKKGRPDPSRILPAPRPSGPMSTLHAPIGSHSVSSGPPYSSSFQGNSLPPMLPPYGGRSGSASVQLPSINGSYGSSRQAATSQRGSGW